MQGAHGRETVTEVKRDRRTFLLYLWVHEPGLFEHVYLLNRFLRHFLEFPVELELLSLHPRRQIRRNTFKEQVPDLPLAEHEGPSRFVPQTPVLAHVELDVKVHTLEWRVAFAKLDVFIPHSGDEEWAMHDFADSPDDFPLVCCIWYVADLYFHRV